jgi:hypothetical protein
MSYKGIFKPKNPSKYRGNPTNIVYRSRWELVVMERFDRDKNVLWWSSEELSIPYKCPTDNRIHRYFPDFLVRVRDKLGKEKTMLIEVKPKAQTQPPAIKEGRARNRRYINEVMTWGKNSAKWKAAREWCADRKIDFVILTEQELGLKF